MVAAGSCKNTRVIVLTNCNYRIDAGQWGFMKCRDTSESHTLPPLPTTTTTTTSSSSASTGSSLLLGVCQPG